MKIGAVLTDYDGTLALMGVPREESEVPADLQNVLRALGRRALVGIVTAKDYQFVYPRTRFASAWACAGGLEIRALGRAVEEADGLKDLSEPLDSARALARGGVVLEVKRGESGRVLGFSLDWSGARKPEARALSRLRRVAKDRGYVAEDEKGSFIDVFARAPDKGKAVRKLRSIIKPPGSVMFIGDSPGDNPAYREVEVSVGVAHGQDLGDLDCEYVVTQQDLVQFLQALLDRGMEFSPTMPWVEERKD